MQMLLLEVMLREATFPKGHWIIQLPLLKRYGVVQVIHWVNELHSRHGATHFWHVYEDL